MREGNGDVVDDCDSQSWYLEVKYDDGFSRKSFQTLITSSGDFRKLTSFDVMKVAPSS